MDVRIRWAASARRSRFLALAALCATGMEVVPHIVIGLHYGRILGEANALDIVARHAIHALVLVVIMPFYAEPGRFETPSPHAVGEIFLAARERLPAREVPADFDDAILASVPYAAYRAMEPLRRERVPVYLEEHFLPAVVRSPATRLVGVAASLLAVVAAAAFEVPAWWPVVVAAGLVPELLVRAQGLGRRVVALRRAEG